jgi:hydantoinase/carbamoylase family amidase
MTLGARILEQCDELGAISEDPDVLTRRYLTKEHRRAATLIAGWMRDAGLDVEVDALGNVVGRRAGAHDGAPRIVTGSHFDTVVNAGRYDGIFGILCAIAAVGELHARGVRPAHAIEVVAFGDEEGVRFGFSMVGSRALAGRFDPALLDRRDADGTTLREAIVAFGGDVDAIPALSRAHGDVAAFVEVHIEQGPVLLDRGLALGVVTSIAGSTRIAARVTGLAGHAGTVPMGARRDALTAAAEMALYVESYTAASQGVLVGTVGKLAIAGGGAINVIPGEVAFTIDVRAGRDAERLAAVAALERECRAIAARRNVALEWVTLFELAAAPCDEGLQAALAASVAAQGITPLRLPSGAGHDAMEMAHVAPIGMLFVRCGAGGISHHPDETMTAEDANVATHALVHFLEHVDAAATRRALPDRPEAARHAATAGARREHPR